MSCPGNIDAVIKIFENVKDREVTSEEIRTAAGGGGKEWDRYLAGPKTQSLIRHANLSLASLNYEIVSCGINSERWRRVRCAQARAEQATQQLKKITNHLKNAEDNMWAIARDERAAKRLRNDAIAWLHLYHDDDNQKNLHIFEEWSVELTKSLPFLDIDKARQTTESKVTKA